MSARAGIYQTILASPTPNVIYDASVEGGLTIAIDIACHPDTAAPCTGLLVTVAGMHDRTTGGLQTKIYPGGEKKFRRASGITKVTVMGDGGAAIADWSVTEEQ